MPGVGQTISKLGTFFVYTLALSMTIFKKKSLQRFLEKMLYLANRVCNNMNPCVLAHIFVCDKKGLSK